MTDIESVAPASLDAGSQLVDDQVGRRGDLPKMATLRDVAAKVGVSPRTVSRVVNDEGGYSEETCRRILDAIKELGYRPNMLARGLITRRSRTVGLVVTDMTDPFFLTLAEIVQNRLRSHEQTMFFASSGNDPHRQSEVLESFLSHAVDGMIVFPAQNSRRQLVEGARHWVPTVVIDELIDATNIACVGFDRQAGTRLGVEHLRATGRRRIGMIGSSFASPAQRRSEESFLNVIADVPEACDQIVRVPPTVEGGDAGLEELLQLRPDLEGVMTFNDLVAIGAVRRSRARGLSVPHDVAVIGFNDIDVSALVDPPLTTVRLDRALLAEATTAALRRLIDVPGEQLEPVVLPVELVVRQSA